MAQSTLIYIWSICSRFVVGIYNSNLYCTKITYTNPVGMKTEVEENLFYMLFEETWVILVNQDTFVRVVMRQVSIQARALPHIDVWKRFAPAQIRKLSRYSNTYYFNSHHSINFMDNSYATYYRLFSIINDGFQN